MKKWRKWNSPLIFVVSFPLARRSEVQSCLRAATRPSADGSPGVSEFGGKHAVHGFQFGLKWLDSLWLCRLCITDWLQKTTLLPMLPLIAQDGGLRRRGMKAQGLRIKWRVFSSCLQATQGTLLGQWDWRVWQHAACTCIIWLSVLNFQLRNFELQKRTPQSWELLPTSEWWCNNVTRNKSQFFLWYLN